jgi:hypothetical protein
LIADGKELSSPQWPGCEVDHSANSKGEVHHMAWCLIKRREDFTFTLIVTIMYKKINLFAKLSSITTSLLFCITEFVYRICYRLCRGGNGLKQLTVGERILISYAGEDCASRHPTSRTFCTEHVKKIAVF